VSPDAARHGPALPPVRLALTVFLPFAVGYFLSYLYRTVNAVLADDLAAAAGTDAAGLGLLTSVYFVSFAAFQIPLGLLLDRYGPRRVEALLLVVAAGGAWLFSIADDLASMTVARAVIGFGVSACLMGAFKNTVMWWPKDRLPLINGLVLAFGGLGALVAAKPVVLLLDITDWRGVFRIIAVLTLIAAAFLWTAVPERKDAAARAAGTLRQQVAALGALYRDRFFWRVAPLTVLIQASHMAYQGLWAAPWLTTVDGFDRDAVAATLQAMAIAMVLGYVLIGGLAERLARIGIRPLAVSAALTLTLLVVEALLLVPGVAPPAVLWSLFGFLATASILGYAIVTQAVPAEMAGRANTALNLIGFSGAFVAQAGLGVVIDAVAGWTGDPAMGHRAALALLLGLSIVAWLWYVRPGADRVLTGRPAPEADQ
jgi:sugar phosphate permease